MAPGRRLTSRRRVSRCELLCMRVHGLQTCNMTTSLATGYTSIHPCVVYTLMSPKHHRVASSVLQGIEEDHRFEQFFYDDATNKVRRAKGGSLHTAVKFNPNKTTFQGLG